MITLKSLLCEATAPKISLQQALDKGMFGPVYHGTDQENRSKIDQEGFKIIVGLHGTSGMSHGYENQPYGFAGAPPPIHHLGFGVYFTTVKSIAKSFSGGTLRGMKVYYLDAPRMETINWGSPRTMMKWWVENGYDTELSQRGEGGRYMATVKMTEKLKSQWDAIWYKGKGVRRLLDGDQVVAFDLSIIYEIDLSLAKGIEVGAKVVAKNEIVRLNYEGKPYGNAIPAGTRGIVVKRDDVAKKHKEYPPIGQKTPNNTFWESSSRREATKTWKTLR
jgi:hypothetical protein